MYPLAERPIWLRQIKGDPLSYGRITKKWDKFEVWQLLNYTTHHHDSYMISDQHTVNFQGMR